MRKPMPKRSFQKSLTTTGAQRAALIGALITTLLLFAGRSRRRTARSISRSAHRRRPATSRQMASGVEIDSLCASSSTTAAAKRSAETTLSAFFSEVNPRNCSNPARPRAAISALFWRRAKTEESQSGDQIHRSARRSVGVMNDLLPSYLNPLPPLNKAPFCLSRFF